MTKFKWKSRGFQRRDSSSVFDRLLGSAAVAAGLCYFTRLFLEYTVLLEPFFLSAPARRTLGSADSRGLRPLPPTPRRPFWSVQPPCDRLEAAIFILRELSATSTGCSLSFLQSCCPPLPADARKLSPDASRRPQNVLPGSPWDPPVDSEGTRGCPERSPDASRDARRRAADPPGTSKTYVFLKVSFDFHD